ncbi:ATP-binding protein [Candidatus Deferrimicrobium sp.]|uniref:ATP-binding protein n=1 Tax=Candidatus Deferrimicrobium sp. TaxID=3060586 RepID=UPI0032C222BE
MTNSIITSSALTDEEPPCDDAGAGPGEGPGQCSVAPSSEHAPDLSEAVGQTMARRALEVAAAGCHAMLLVEKGVVCTGFAVRADSRRSFPRKKQRANR